MTLSTLRLRSLMSRWMRRIRRMSSSVSTNIFMSIRGSSSGSANIKMPSKMMIRLGVRDSVAAVRV
eukprot:CAMPEP_0173190356 /NCGR_PEP_ID=MMETSP1141-20130122/12300_1 /TAXON_ID=483371 /ORGANISM="non described non described, Strain CCMP2298" /LENGTH=65 /DNA_ID=CAMNT_0014114457 /DNA_START=264 /DNA_END=461 /DNA_ORIENTATION=+